MSGKKTTPDQSTQAVILREAGYTLPAIATRLDLSISTVQRILKTNKAVAGASTQALIERAREEMLNMAFAMESVQQTAASLVLDDLALSQNIRMKLALALDALDLSNPIAFRSLAASATTLKLTQEVARRALPLDKLEQALEVEELPVLHIEIMNSNDVAKMRAQQRLEEAEINGDIEGFEDEQANICWYESKELAQAQHPNADNIVEG